MDLKIFFAVGLISNFVYAAPTGDKNNTEYKEGWVIIYTAEYDVVNIVLPINGLNLERSSHEAKYSTPLIFFVLADNNGEQISYKGLYVRKNGEVTKLLDNGRDATAANYLSKTAYFAASDGIYTYNDKENKAEKYGTITDNIIGITKLNISDELYILTEDHVVWKVTDGGTKKNKISEIDNAQQIVLDYEDNLYYISNNDIYIYGPGGVKKVEVLPKNSNHSIQLYRAPFVLTNGIPAVIDKEMYLVFSNTTLTGIANNSSEMPTAISAEGTFISYVGHNKKIYEFNIITIIFDALATKFQNYINSLIENIKKNIY